MGGTGSSWWTRFCFHGVCIGGCGCFATALVGVEWFWLMLVWRFGGFAIGLLDGVAFPAIGRFGWVLCVWVLCVFVGLLWLGWFLGGLRGGLRHLRLESSGFGWI